MNEKNFFFEDSKKSFKERRLLKIKLNKISKDIIKKNCDKYLTKMRNLKVDEINNSNTVNNIIKQSLNFHFGDRKTYSLNNQYKNIINVYKSINSNLSEFDLNCHLFVDTLKRELTSSELHEIRNDKKYYLPDYKIRNNTNLFRDKPLYMQINEEEKNINSINNINGSKSNSYNHKIKNMLLTPGKKILKNAHNSYSNININIDEQGIRDKLKEINHEIKRGIFDLKEKEKNKKLKKEKTINAFKKMRQQATKEVISLINDPNYQSVLFNKNKYIIEGYADYKYRGRNKNYKINNFDNFLSFRKNNNTPKNALFSNKKKLPKAFSNIFIGIKDKNIKSLFNESKIMDTLEKKNIKEINSSRLRSYKKKILNKASSDLEKIIGTDKKKDNDEINEKKNVIFMKNKIKEIYNKNNNTILKNKTMYDNLLTLYKK